MANANMNSTDTGTAERSAVQPRLPHAAIYVVSVTLVVVIFFLLQSLSAPSLGNQTLYLFLVPPVLIAGALGGIGPGLLSTALSLGLHLYVTGAYSSLIDTGSPFFAAEVSRAATFTTLG